MSFLQRKKIMRELQKNTKVVNLYIIALCFDTRALSLSLFMMRRIHQFGTSFFITATSLSLLFFPSFLVVFGEEEEKRI